MHFSTIALILAACLVGYAHCATQAQCQQAAGSDELKQVLATKPLTPTTQPFLFNYAGLSYLITLINNDWVCADVSNLSVYAPIDASILNGNVAQADTGLSPDQLAAASAECLQAISSGANTFTSSDSNVPYLISSVSGNLLSVNALTGNAVLISPNVNVPVNFSGNNLDVLSVDALNQYNSCLSILNLLPGLLNLASPILRKSFLAQLDQVDFGLTYSNGDDLDASLKFDICQSTAQSLDFFKDSCAAVAKLVTKFQKADKIAARKAAKAAKAAAAAQAAAAAKAVAAKAAAAADAKAAQSARRAAKKAEKKTRKASRRAQQADDEDN